MTDTHHLPSAPIPGFHGRKAELAWLRGSVEEVADVAFLPDGRMHVAQALYGRHRIWSWGDEEQSVVMRRDG